MEIDLWQVPVLIMAVVALLAFWDKLVPKTSVHIVAGRVRIIGLGLAAAVMLPFLVIALRAIGTSTAANLATIASALIEGLILWLAYKSYQEQTAESRSIPKAPENDVTKSGTELSVHD